MLRDKNNKDFTWLVIYNGLLPVRSRIVAKGWRISDLDGSKPFVNERAHDLKVHLSSVEGRARVQIWKSHSSQRVGVKQGARLVCVKFRVIIGSVRTIYPKKSSSSSSPSPRGTEM